MALEQRRILYNKIELHRSRPLLVYVTSKRNGVSAAMATDALPYLVDQIQVIDSKEKELDLLIASYGGDPMVAWRIMSILRDRFDKVSVLIPQSAYSAATLLALGADEIVMHPFGHLGPVDMQITTFTEGRRRDFSTEDISTFLEFVREELGITDQEHLRRLFEMTCKEVETLGVGFTARSGKSAVGLAEKLLGFHMTDDTNGAKRKAIIEHISRQCHSHAYPVSRQEAHEMGLPVSVDQDTELEDLMWALWLELEAEMKERELYDPIIELLRSSEGQKLLTPVPQLSMPINAPSPNYLQANINEVNGDVNMNINPVEFSYIDAMIESEKLAFHSVAKGKILACRTPDLMIHYNSIFTSRGWIAVTI